jgi:hypothetical protein
MELDRDVILFTWTIAIFFGFLINIIINSPIRIFFCVFNTILLILEIWFNLYHKIYALGLKLSEHSSAVITFILVPLFFTFCIELGMISFPSREEKQIILNCYDKYLLISTVFLSVSIVIMTYYSDKRTRKSKKYLKNEDYLTNKLFLIYSVAAIVFSLIAYLITSFVPVEQLYPDFIAYFLISSFFVIGTIFGLMDVTGIFTKIILNPKVKQ